MEENQGGGQPMKEQIEEMTFILNNCCDDVPNDVCENTPCNRCRAKRLYNAGYRKQREGEWIEHIEKPDWLEDDVDVHYECSLCGAVGIGPTPYCHNCGAKMKGGAE
jgi:hypothetical protein